MSSSLAQSAEDLMSFGSELKLMRSSAILAKDDEEWCWVSDGRSQSVCKILRVRFFLQRRRFRFGNFVGKISALSEFNRLFFA